MVDGDWLRGAGEEMVVKNFGLPIDGVDQVAVRVVEWGKSVDLLAFLDSSEGPDVLGLFGVVEVFVGPLALCLCEGASVGLSCLTPFLAWAGIVGRHVQCGAHVVPPVDPVGVVVLTGFEGCVTGIQDSGVEEVEGVEEVWCSYGRATDDGARGPISIRLCPRGWVIGWSHFCPRPCIGLRDQV